MATNRNSRLIVYGGPNAIRDKSALNHGLRSIARGAWRDFKQTNDSSASTVFKAGAGLIVGSAIAKPLRYLTPLQWAARGSGPLP